MADFAKIWGAGLSVDQKVTSTELNQLDTDHSNSLNRTGGNITGTITVTATGSIVYNHSSSAWFKGATLKIDTDGTFASNLRVINGEIRIEDPDGSLVLYGTKVPTFATPRTRSVVIPLGAMGTISGTAASGVSGYATGAVGGTYNYQFYPPHDGATIDSVDFLWCPDTGHAALPGTKPAMSVLRRAISPGSTNGTGAALSSTAVQSYAPVSLADYNNGLVHAMNYACDQNNVVDTSQYAYHVIFQDESGANSTFPATLVGIRLNYTDIADMRFQ